MNILTKATVLVLNRNWQAINLPVYCILGQFDPKLVQMAPHGERAED